MSRRTTRTMVVCAPAMAAAWWSTPVAYGSVRLMVPFNYRQVVE